MPIARIDQTLEMYCEDHDFAEPMHALMPVSELVVIPGTHGVVQHTAPEQCVDAWRSFVREVAAST